MTDPNLTPEEAAFVRAWMESERRREAHAIEQWKRVCAAFDLNTAVNAAANGDDIGKAKADR